MKDYLYAAEMWRDNFQIKKIEIVKDTNKSFMVSDTSDVYDHRTWIPKNHPHIAHSEEEAIKIFIRNRSDKLTKLENKLENLSDEINRAYDKAKELGILL